MSIYNDEYPALQVLRYRDLREGGVFPLTAKKALDASAEAGHIVYPVRGNWRYRGLPLTTMILGNDSIFQIKGLLNDQTYIHKIDYDVYGTDNDGLQIKMLTNTIPFDSLKNVKELVSLNVAVTGTGLKPTLRVGTRQEYDNEITWTEIPGHFNEEGYIQYWLREAGEFKYINFELSWYNNANVYISSINAVSLTVRTVKEKIR